MGDDFVAHLPLAAHGTEALLQLIDWTTRLSDDLGEMVLQQRAQEDHLRETAGELGNDAEAHEVGLLDLKPESFLYGRFLGALQPSPHGLGEPYEGAGAEDQHF